MFPQLSNLDCVAGGDSFEITIELVPLQSTSSIVLSPNVLWCRHRDSGDLESSNNTFCKPGRVDDDQVARFESWFHSPQFDNFCAGKNRFHETWADGQKECVIATHFHARAQPGR